MNCLSNITLKGIANSCEANLAGIAEVYIGYYGDFDVEVSESAQTVTTFTAATAGVSANLYKYEFAKQTGSLTSTLTKDEANGVRYFTNELVLQFTKMEAAKHLEMTALAAEKLIAIVKTNNGNYFFVGYDGYLSATEGTAQSGQAFGDLNGYNLTMSQMSAYLPFEIQYDDFSAYISKSN